MTGVTQAKPTDSPPLRRIALGLGTLATLFVAWHILLPFLPALAWALAVSIIMQPLHRRFATAPVPPALSALAGVVFASVVIFVPCIMLSRIIGREAIGIVNWLHSEGELQNLRSVLDRSVVLGPPLSWLDAQLNLPEGITEIVRAAAGWASTAFASALAGSVWLLTQIGVTLFVLFYFLRDGDAMVARLRCLIPLPPTEVEHLFGRISQIIRVSLGGKIVVACVQGALGGLMFWWLNLPAPVFWGFVMAALSVFPVIGAFLVWFPATVMLALQQQWWQALLLAVWGLLVISLVDNLLGPILVGSQLKIHTLLTFFSIMGGLSAFGAAGIVIGPLTIAVALTLVEWAESRQPLFGYREGN